MSMSSRNGTIKGTAREVMRVALDAEVLPSSGGGIAHALLALVRALAAISSDSESYVLIVASEEQEAFWRPQLGSNQTLVRKGGAEQSKKNGFLRAAKSVVSVAARPCLRALDRRFAASKPQWPEVPLSDGFYEGLGCDVIHMTWQRFVVCGVPTIYNPHDLQHLHLPGFFTSQELAWRETMFPTGFRLARTVVVGSHWTKNDIVRQYGVDPAKIQVIPEGALNQFTGSCSEQEIESVKARYRLPERYALYPAITWPHKNHLQLLDALALLRNRGFVAPLVLTGSQRQPHWGKIEKRIRELHLEDQVHALGFLPESDLRIIQKLASALVQPSLFEASSLPIYDAWFDGVPVACSRASALPEQVGDAALLFDPHNCEQVADAIAGVMGNPDVCDDLRTKGFRRMKDFNWTRSAKAYRAVYRRAAGVSLTEEDRWLLQWDWMREPDKSRPMEVCC